MLKTKRGGLYDKYFKCKERKSKQSDSSLQIDSYTISLADGVYDENTKLGLLLFKVTNSEGAVDANISSSNQLGGNTFGK